MISSDYNNKKILPITESSLIAPTNLYGQNKACVEKILNNLHSQSHWKYDYIKVIHQKTYHIINSLMLAQVVFAVLSQE